MTTRKPAAQKEDPGPSVRVRTSAERAAIIEAQVEDREYYIHSFSALEARAFANRVVKLTARAWTLPDCLFCANFYQRPIGKFAICTPSGPN